MGLRRRPYHWQPVPWSIDPILTRGLLGGLPVISWGWADRSRLATRRQLRALGLRPGGASPVAVLEFGHRRPGRRIEHAYLYLIEQAVPRRVPTEAQLAAVAKALAARRTCTRCRRQQGRCLPAASRMCGPCEEVTGFWPRHAAEHGWSWAA